jgi:hypothetical protein
MSRFELLSLALVPPALLAAGLLAQEPAAVTVEMADGSRFPLRAWALSYEYLAWPAGSTQGETRPERKQSRDLVVGKKRIPLSGSVLEVVYEDVSRSREVDGEARLVRVPLAKQLALSGADGKIGRIRLEPPEREFVLPSAPKGTMLLIRSVDLVGETMTGTKRTLCLASFTSLVECALEPSQQVMKVEFP